MISPRAFTGSALEEILQLVNTHPLSLKKVTMTWRMPHSNTPSEKGSTKIGIETNSSTFRMVLYIKPMLHKPNKKLLHQDQKFYLDNGIYLQRHGCRTSESKKELASQLITDLSRFVFKPADEKIGIRMTKSGYRDFGTRVILYAIEVNDPRRRIAASIANILSNGSNETLSIVEVEPLQYTIEEARNKHIRIDG